MRWPPFLFLAVCLVVVVHDPVVAYLPPECELCRELPDYWEVLKLNETSDHSTIRKTCRTLRAKWHPDKNTANPAAAKEQWEPIDAACKVLSKKRSDLGADVHSAADMEDSYEDYISKWNLCKDCAVYEKQQRSSFDPFDMFARAKRAAWEDSGSDEAGSGFPRHWTEEPYVENGRRWMREIYCEREYSCHARDLFEIVDNRGYRSWLENGGWYAWRETSGGADQKFDPILRQSEFLKNGAYLTSADGSHFAIMLPDGNFAIYEGSGPRDAGERPIWQTSTHTSSSSSFCQLGTDGNLGVFVGTDPMAMESVLWHSNRRADMGMWSRVYGKLENDGNLVIWSDSGVGDTECVWASVACPGRGLMDNPASAIRRLRNTIRLSSKKAFGERQAPARRSDTPVAWLRQGFKSIWAWLTGALRDGPQE